MKQNKQLEIEIKTLSEEFNNFKSLKIKEENSIWVNKNSELIEKIIEQ